MLGEEHDAVTDTDLKVPRRLHGRITAALDQHDVHILVLLKSSDRAPREQRPLGHREAHCRIRDALDLECLSDLDPEGCPSEDGRRQIGRAQYRMNIQKILELFCELAIPHPAHDPDVRVPVPDLHDGLHVRLVVPRAGNKGLRMGHARFFQGLGKSSIPADDRDAHLPEPPFCMRTRGVVDGYDVQTHRNDVSDHPLTYMSSPEHDDMISVRQRQRLRPRVSTLVSIEHQIYEIGCAEADQ